GYEDYYRIRDSQDVEGRQARLTGRSFEDFDDPGFQDEYVTTTGRGTCSTRLYLEGVHCAACVWLVETLPKSVDGLVGTRLNLASAIATVEWDPERVALSEVSHALDSVGYTPHAHRADEAAKQRQREDRALVLKLGVAAACAMNIMFLHGALYAGEAQGMEPRFETFFRWLSFALALPVVLYSARPFYRAAWAGLKRRIPHMDLPIAIALTAAFGFSAVSTLRGSGPVYFDSLAALVALLLGARYVQQRAQRAALERAGSLRDVAFAEYARLIEPVTTGADDLEDPAADLAVSHEVPLSVLRRGDRVEVRSGELIPVDGQVIQGRSSVNNAALTGEPDPVAVGPGSEVFAGATNLGAKVVVEVSAAGADSRVGALLALVEDAMASRAPIVHVADRISRYFVTAVLLLAAITTALWIGTSVGTALEQTVALLVVTCPCALGLATPVAMTVGLARAARAGIFVKSQDAFERLRGVDTMLLDKTGTLTEGRPVVSRWEGEEQAIELGYALEAESSHVVALAFRRSRGRPVRVARVVTEAQELAGEGICGRVDGHDVAVGNRALIDRLGAALPGALAGHAEQLITAGLSPLYVARDGAVAAVGGVGDPLREDAKATVAALRSRGVEARILSGDHPAVVARVAAELGIEPSGALGGLSPEDKRDVVASLVAERRGSGRIAMVGDGVNDAAAMALSDVGVAVHGGAGASIAAADVVLTRPGLAPLLQVVTGARRLIGVVLRNLLFSLIYNMAGATLAILGLVGPLLAAILMPISSLTVILSSVLARPFGRARSVSPRQPAEEPQP
ncbi:MAG: heavy metal translocating P-type ATPase, partial [Deltaproteobacteria bacterium]|nr:heavy metal translocating P-type ATPase [Deltaproteobacteria bacterium]